MTKRINTREIVLDILIGVFEKGKLSHVVIRNTLEREGELTEREKAFVTRMAEGTIEKTIELDYIINCYSKVPVNKMKPVIRNIMRMSLYQIIYMDGVPDSAACNEGVKLAASRGFSGLRGFVNGVLRSYIRNPEKGKYSDDNYMLKYSVPGWIIDMWMTDYGRDRTIKMLERQGAPDCISVRRNKSKCSREELLFSFNEDGIDAVESGYVPDVFYIKNRDRIANMGAMKKGMIQVQDLSSVLAGMALAPEEGGVCIDVCAAPGGKSLHAADNVGKNGVVYSRDITEDKVRLIRENAKRTGFSNIKAQVYDAMLYDASMHEKADYLIADLPCSGLGVMAKKTDIKYKTKPEDISNLAIQQRKILSMVSDYLKPGGIMVYSTCTVNTEENDENFRWILENLPFEAESLEGKIPEKMGYDTAKNGYIQIFNGDFGMDGFFMARFKKKRRN